MYIFLYFFLFSNPFCCVIFSVFKIYIFCIFLLRLTTAVATTSVIRQNICICKLKNFHLIAHVVVALGFVSFLINFFILPIFFFLPFVVLYFLNAMLSFFQFFVSFFKFLNIYQFTILAKRFMYKYIFMYVCNKAVRNISFLL